MDGTNVSLDELINCTILLLVEETRLKISAMERLLTSHSGDLVYLNKENIELSKNKRFLQSIVYKQICANLIS